MPEKLVFLNWIYDVGRISLFSPKKQSRLQKEIIEKVRDAVDNLPSMEKEFVQLYWFEGKSMAELSELFGKKPYKLESLNKRILQKLKRRLSEYVTRQFDLTNDTIPACIICDHPRRIEIDNLLLSKGQEETFRPIYRKLKDEFGLTISTPQILIGHIRYHLQKED
ncbi:MAG: sigma-70 family RNA polymerase sigma factor [candidate division Zixibacteria bacterium]|nr:sigma-70 family RNA polymerase sigma factor [candidate division Zixibacteria bacterium]MBU1469924.1 sigma-70 family RNA polymerase sigma factor [candidate division Zixibacteria bacterium]MBU2626943.1 sigma-70 family RNA polymerase sigma factor [candidate division Zixibacteria bacterium]